MTVEEALKIEMSLEQALDSLYNVIRMVNKHKFQCDEDEEMVRGIILKHLHSACSELENEYFYWISLDLTPDSSEF
jgi:hypothetical protein